MKELKVGSLFAGVGGICLGLLNAKQKDYEFRIAFANEIDSFACETYRRNFSHPLLEGDINFILHPENSNDIEYYQKLHEQMFSEPIDVLDGGFPCLTGDTMVLTKRGYIPIVKVKPGDMVLSHDGDWHTVIRFMEQGKKEVYKLHVTDTPGIRATANHRFYVIFKKFLGRTTEPAWVSVEELMMALKENKQCFIASSYEDISDVSETAVLKDNIIWLPVEAIESAGIKQVYDIEVADTHSFVANGLVTHNCQAFSIAGAQRGFADDRGNLFLSIVDVINQMDKKFHKKPRFLFLENVKNLKNHDNGRTYQVIKGKLEECGYIIKDAILNTATFSTVPQNRERIYIIGFLYKEDADSFTMFDHLNDFKVNLSLEERKKTVKNIIDETVQDERYFYTKDKYPDYFEELGQPIKKKERVNIAEGITEKDEFYQLRRGLYVRKNQNHVCPTLTANMGTGGHNVPLIFTDYGIRKITPIESFKLQGFPIGNGYVLPTEYKGKPYAIAHLYKQAGNAVSVPVITLIANEILKACSKGDLIMSADENVKEPANLFPEDNIGTATTECVEIISDEPKEEVKTVTTTTVDVKPKRKRRSWKEGKPAHFQALINAEVFEELKKVLKEQNMSLSEWTEMMIQQFLRSQMEEAVIEEQDIEKTVSEESILKDSVEKVEEPIKEEWLFDAEIGKLRNLYLLMKDQIPDCTLADAVAFYGLMVKSKSDLEK